MAQLATQGVESAIVLAPANPLAEKCDSSLEQAFRASLPELQALPKDMLLLVNVDVTIQIVVTPATMAAVAASEPAAKTRPPLVSNPLHKNVASITVDIRERFELSDRSCQ